MDNSFLSRSKMSRLSKIVKFRDGWTCQICGWSPKNRKQKKFLHAHHIKPKAIFPQFAFDKDNLISVCWFHHWDLSDSNAKKFLESDKPADSVLRKMQSNPIKSEEDYAKLKRLCHF